MEEQGVIDQKDEVEIGPSVSPGELLYPAGRSLFFRTRTKRSIRKYSPIYRERDPEKHWKKFLEYFDKVGKSCHPFIEVAYNGSSLGTLVDEMGIRGLSGEPLPWLNSDNFSFSSDLPAILGAIVLFAALHWLFRDNKIWQRTVRQFFAGLRNMLRVVMVVVHGIGELDVTLASCAIALSLAVIYAFFRARNEWTYQQIFKAARKGDLSSLPKMNNCLGWATVIAVGIIDGIYLVSAIINILMMVVEAFDLSSNITKGVAIAVIVAASLASLATKWYENYQCNHLQASETRLPAHIAVFKQVSEHYTYFREFFNGIKNFTTPVNVIFMIMVAAGGGPIPIPLVIGVLVLGCVYGIYLHRKKKKEIDELEKALSKSSEKDETKGAVIMRDIPDADSNSGSECPSERRNSVTSCCG